MTDRRHMRRQKRVAARLTVNLIRSTPIRTVTLGN